MCTGVGWKVFCRNYCTGGCRSVLFIDFHSVPGHVCRLARERGGRRGLCRTGVEWTYYDRVSPDEECLFCEMLLSSDGFGFTAAVDGDDVAAVTAETCDEACAEETLEEMQVALGIDMELGVGMGTMMGGGAYVYEEDEEEKTLGEGEVGIYYCYREFVPSIEEYEREGAGEVEEEEEEDRDEDGGASIKSDEDVGEGEGEGEGDEDRDDKEEGGVKLG